MHADEVMTAVRPLVEAGRVPGAIVGVRHRGRTSTVAAGTTAPGGDEPLRADAQVRVASNTKPVVAALTLMLVEDGVLGLDEPVTGLLPELADQPVMARLDGPLDDVVPADRVATVADLLAMRLGFGFVVEGHCSAYERADALDLVFGPADPTGPPDPDEWLARFATLPLLDQPGAAWRYELSFAVLGVLLVRAAGRPLPDLLDERVLRPLAMADTSFVVDPARLVPAHSADDDRFASFDGVADSRWLRPPAFPDARSGLVSTAADLLRFAAMLLDDGGSLLPAAAVEAMTTDRLTDAQRGSPSARAFLDGGGWGYGVGVSDSAAGRRYGWGGGLGTLWWSWPEHDLAAVLLTQVTPPVAAVYDAFTDAVERLATG